MPRPIILTFVAYYLPGYRSGGPVRTIANMVEQLGDELDFRIVTADRDALSTEPYPHVDIDDWNTVGKAQVYYASPGHRSVVDFARLCSRTPHDVLYLNSFFSPGFTIYPLLARRLGLMPKRPTVVAPRGEFSSGALALKWWKKRIYISLSRALGIHRDLRWQASSDYEAQDIRRVMGSSAKRIIVAPDLTANPDDAIGEEEQRHRTTDHLLRVCFLSRITPKKNLDYTLRVLAQVRVRVEYDIYGVIGDESYWQGCHKLINAMPGHVKVNYHGVVDHASVAQTLSQYDLFFFPTRGENFGHVIFEALSSGLPVLISDQTPWRDLEANGVGWDLPLDAPERFRAVIETQAELSDEAWAAQHHRTKQYARRIAEDGQVRSANLALFTDLCC